MGTTAAMTNAGLLSVANQSGITGLGTISSGTWQGTAIASAYLDSDTAHLTTDQTFTGVKEIDSRKYAYPGTTDGDHKAGDIMYYDSGTATTVAGKIYYFHGGDDSTNGSWTATNASAASSATGLIGVALGDTPANDGVLLRGIVDLADDIAGTEAMGSILYLSDSVAGGADTVAPSDTNDIVRVIGYAVTTGNTNKIWFNPDNTWVEHT